MLPQRVLALVPSFPTGTWGRLGLQLRDVFRDLPVFPTSPLHRRWHLTWGATPTQAAATLPGDEFLPPAPYRSTRAISIKAPPASVGPWLVQVGCYVLHPATMVHAMAEYRDFGPRRVAVDGQGRWHAPAPEGQFAYLEFELDDIINNPTHAGGKGRPQARDALPGMSARIAAAWLAG